MRKADATSIGLQKTNKEYEEELKRDTQDTGKLK